MPIKLHTAVTDSRFSFESCHRADGGNIKNVKTCAVCGEVVATADICSKYTLEGHPEPIIFSKSELAQIKPESSGDMSILTYRTLEELKIPEIAFDKPIYVGTGNLTEKKKPLPSEKIEAILRPFHLFRKALIKANKVAVVKWVSHYHIHYAILKPYANGFLIREVLYPQEVKSFGDVEIVEREVADNQVDVVVQAISKNQVAWDWGSLVDNERATIEEMIQAKVDGKVIPVEELVPEQTSDSVDDWLKAIA